MSKDELVFIRDSRFVVGNCASWWRPNGHGYTTDVDQAWKVSRAVAEQYGLRDSDELIPASAVLVLTERHFDVQLLPKVRGK